MSAATANPPLESGEDFLTDPRSAGSAKRRSRFNKILTTICVGLSFLTLIPLVSILFVLLKNGLPLLTPAVFSSLPPGAGMTEGGFGNAVVGTLIMVGLGLVMSAPIGVFAAVFINEYSPKSALANTVRFVAKLLTGIPSIICGVFAFGAVVLVTGGFSAFAGGVALAVLMMPTILLTSEQALMGVPSAYREAAYGLGATRFQAITRIVLPDALPAMMTGIMLAVARAAGETAPLIFTALFSQYWMNSIMEPTASLSVLIYNFSTLPFEYQIQLAWTASLVLVLMVTISNITAQLVFSKRN